MRRLTAAGLAGAVILLSGGAALGAGAFGDGDGAPADGPSSGAVAATGRAATPLVLVSGRDDHGELVSDAVAVYASPGSAKPVGEVRDGTLARIVAVEGTWLEVRTVEGAPVEGWVDDYYLRREIHLVGAAPSCAVALDGAQLEAGAQAVVLEIDHERARVQLEGGSGTTGWVARSSVHEIAPRHGCEVEATQNGQESGHHH